MAAIQAIDWQGALDRARAESPFLARSLDRLPELARCLAAGQWEAALEQVQAAGAGQGELGAALRKERVALSTALAIGDLAGALSFEQVVRLLSQCADRSLDRAIADAINHRVEGAGSQGLVALALGKQGASELNYSSDIDPILLFDPETLPRRPQDEPGEAAARYVRHIVKLLTENTAEGFVFRVDLRLRPASEVSPPALSLASAQSHYESSALAWERAAFVRARAAAGDIAAGEHFLDAIKPFIWRSNLDFGAVEEVRRLTAQIRLNYDGRPDPGPGFDVKRGRGGIREVEFFAQTHQLIHGGRDPSLRLRGTCDALCALADAERIDREVADTLSSAYRRLRTIEHRLQMVHDRQTHSLPEGAALDSVARLDGLKHGDELVEELRELTESVGQHYDRLIGEQPSAVPAPVPTTPVIERIAEVDEAQREAIAGRIEAWRDGRYQSLRTPQALAAFDAIMPVLAGALVEADDPERAITRWENLLEKASSAINLFHLLQARPGLLNRLISALSVAAPLADELGRRPELLDALIDKSALELPGSVEEIVERMRNIAAREDYEAQLDCIRVVTSEMRFALGVQLIEAINDPLDIAIGLCRTAEAALTIASEAAAKEFAKQHGHIPGGELIILGLGRLGGGALSHASDLDIIYLFTGDVGAESDGDRPLSTTLYFNRLATRVSAALSVPTAQGALYEVDTRLRPQGNQGPLAVSLEAFAKYQREAAWTWEHMALARARVLIGSPKARGQLDAIVHSVLTKRRDPAALRDRVLSMRKDMAQHKQARGGLDIKLQRGGLIDYEFLIHFLQLRDGIGLTPDFAEALPQLVEAGSIPPELIPAYDLMTRLLVAGRLLAPDGVEPPQAAARSLAAACQVETYNDLLRRLGAARQEVAKAWDAILEAQLEID